MCIYKPGKCIIVVIVSYFALFLLDVRQYDEKDLVSRTLFTWKTNIQAKFVYSHDVLVTPHEDIVVIDTSKFVKFFQENGNYTGFSSMLIDKVEPGMKTNCLATRSTGQYLIGDNNRRMITIHEKQTGGKDFSPDFSSGKISLTTMPRYLAVFKNQQVIVSDWETKKAVSLTMSGQQLFAIHTRKPYGLSFDPEGNVSTLLWVHQMIPIFTST